MRHTVRRTVHTRVHVCHLQLSSGERQVRLQRQPDSLVEVHSGQRVVQAVAPLPQMRHGHRADGVLHLRSGLRRPLLGLRLQGQRRQGQGKEEEKTSAAKISKSAIHKTGKSQEAEGTEVIIWHLALGTVTHPLPKVDRTPMDLAKISPQIVGICVGPCQGKKGWGWRRIPQSDKL